MPIKLTNQNSQVCIIDVQGRLAEVVSDSDDMFRNLIKLVKTANLVNTPVVYVEHCAEKLGPTSYKLLPFLKSATCVQKNTFSVADAPDFKNSFQNNTGNHILVCGTEAHVCVYQSVRDLIALGYSVIAVADCMSSRTVNDKNLAIELMRQQGAIVMSTEMICFDWIESPANQNFSKFMKIIK